MNNNGWICPKCDAVFAPLIMECKYCKPKNDIGRYTQEHFRPEPIINPYGPKCQHGNPNYCSLCNTVPCLQSDKLVEVE